MASNSIAMLNSVRYRGYVYDSETGLYYLQSRYYDPETGRFLNADDVDYIGFDDSPISYNAFAYCGNNAVNYADYFGTSVSIILGVTAVTLRAVYRAAIILIGITLFCSAQQLYYSGTFDLLVTSLNHYVTVLGECAEDALETLEKELKRVLSKAKDKVKTKKTHKHHIIAKGAKLAEPARNIWVNNLHYDINSNANLISLNRNLHAFLHTKVYYTAVNTIIKEAYEQKKGIGVLAAMALIRGLLYTLSAALG